MAAMTPTGGLFLALCMQMKSQVQAIEKTSDGRQWGDIGLATASRLTDAAQGRQRDSRVPMDWQLLIGDH
jgi:hypothetical protein